MGGDAVVFTPGYFADGDGRTFAPASPPGSWPPPPPRRWYAPFDTFMGTGIVGGRMANFADMGRQAGRIANALLDEIAPAVLRLPDLMPTTLVCRLAADPPVGDR
ncbi:MAG: hypothetical protein MZV65_18155 [Chromatiales bacterium]|nr:hypothetical protein [Chromatiales bacterium]